jgi:hypothetical protein
MGRGLGPFQREVLHRIGRHLATFGEVRTGTITEDLAAARGLPTKVQDDCGFDHRLNVAHQLGLRRALAALEQRGLIIRYRDGWLELTEAGAIAAGECSPFTNADLIAEGKAEMAAARKRREAAIADGHLKPNGQRWY